MRTGVSVAAVLLAIVGCGTTADLPLGGPFRGIGGADAGDSLDAGLGDAVIGFIVPETGTGSSTTTVITGTSSSGATSGVVTSTTGTGVGSSVTTSVGSTSISTSTSSSSSSSSTPSAPTWTYLYDTYLSSASSTIGDCDGSCHHHSQCSSASACYSWIGRGNQGSLTPTGSNALFSWDGNNGGWMPTNGPSSSPQADADFAAWIAAGSQDN